MLDAIRAIPILCILFTVHYGFAKDEKAIPPLESLNEAYITLGVPASLIANALLLTKSYIQLNYNRHIEDFIIAAEVGYVDYFTRRLDEETEYEKIQIKGYEINLLLKYKLSLYDALALRIFTGIGLGPYFGLIGQFDVDSFVHTRLTQPLLEIVPIDIPTLLIFGENDEVVRYETELPVDMEIFTNYNVEIIEGGRHYPHLTLKEEFFNIIF